MRKSFAMDSRARDFREPDYDYDHGHVLDAPRQSAGQATGEDRGLAGPAASRPEPPDALDSPSCAGR